MTLTQRAVDAFKAPETGRVEYFDRVLPGFGLRVGGGRKTWFVMYRVGGKKVRETIGTLAVVPKVERARELARESITHAQGGVHPVEQRRAARRRAAVQAAKQPDTFRAVAELYIERYAKKNTKPGTWLGLQQTLAKDVYPRWGDWPIREITRRDIVELLDDTADRGAPVQANRTLERLRALFNWAMDREIVETSPLTRMKRPTVEKERSRTLSDDEIRLLWLGTDRLGWPFGLMCKLLLLTAQRRTEVAGMRWSELNLDAREWTIPRERAKNDREHVVHLSHLAVEIIEGLPRIGDCDLVFSTTGETHVSGYSKAKARLDEHMLAVLREHLTEAGQDGEQAAIGEWIFHDLRRTAATGMAKLSITPHVVDRILNHVSGTIRGVAAVYNRHAYIEERKVALEAWSRYVQGVIREGPKNVVQLATERG